MNIVSTVNLYSYVLRKLLRNRNSFLYTSGWATSQLHNSPRSGDGEIIPWMNFQIVSLLKARLDTSMTLFEYGCGYSTQFYARHVGKVHSVEHDRAWFEKVRDMVPANVELAHVLKSDDQSYADSIHARGMRFDVVIIDGVHRIKCLTGCFDSVSERGVIIFDDTERRQFSGCVEIARAAGFRSLDFEGIKPASPEFSRATLFYRDGNCLGI